MRRIYSRVPLPLLLLIVSLVPIQGAHAADPAAEKAFDELMAESWEFGMRENPLWASHVGDHRFDDQLGRDTIADHQRRLLARRGFLKRARAVDATRLDPARRISHRIFVRLLSDAITESEHKTYLMPITGRSGFHVSFAQLGERMRLESDADWRGYVARLREFRRYTDEHIALMAEGLRTGYVLPRVVLKGWKDSVQAHIVDDPTESRLYQPFKKAGARFPEGLDEQARDAIAKAVVPAYRAFETFMRDRYVPGCRDTVGASALPDGAAFYQHRVRRYTTLDVTPKQVHEKGLAEVARIRTEMAAVIKKTGFKGDFAAFLKMLRTESRFYAESPEQLMATVALALKRMDGQLPRLFGRLPRMPYGIEQIPAFIAPKATTAYYMPPAGDGSRAGTYFVNTHDLRSRPLYEVEALSLHEAVPGHHLQIALQQELTDVPIFRRHAGFTAFVEGWALYAERLGLEVGFYTDPYADFGRLTYEMWRACRLVVDTGLHALGWSRQQAIDFMAKHSALALHNIETEVDRYIAWPGQALAYKMGELTIRRLRGEAEKALGERFDIRDFHDVVLGSGAVPLDLLQDQVRAWIASR